MRYMLYAPRTDAIIEGETIGYGLSIGNARFGVWVSDVTVLRDLDSADLDDLIEEGNEDCVDLSQGEPLLNYLRSWAQVNKLCFVLLYVFPTQCFSSGLAV